MAVQSSPWLRRPRGVPAVMGHVLLALLPGTAVAVWVWGPGLLLNLALVALGALATEALLLRWRGRPLQRHLFDGSALLTAILLGLSLPPWLPWWQPLLGGAFAIAIGKQLFGGLGYNPFNPAMLGYVMLLISVPVSMTQWPQAGLGWGALPLGYIAGDVPAATLDGLTGATPLDAVRSGLTQQRTLGEMLPGTPLTPALWLAAAWALGGAWLLFQRVISWRIPVAMLAGIALPALIASAIDPDRFAGVGFHWLYGASIFGALFIATDPVSGSTTPRGRLIFGFGVCLLTWIIRSFGGYPDGVAFAVLLMNIAVPLIDAHTPTRVYGTGKAQTPRP